MCLKKLLIFSLIFSVFAAGCKKEEEKTNNNPTPPAAETVKDFDGNVYKTVNINGRTWMAENLKVEHLNDGTALAQFTDEHDWEQANSTTNGGFGYYDGDATNKDKYGVLYDKKAASQKKLCPTGWRVADAGDWNNLIEFVGGDNAEASAKLRATTGWQSLPNVEHVDGTDVYGFNAQPSGTFDSREEIFEDLLYGAYYWTDNDQYVFLRTDRLKKNFDDIGEFKNDGLSVRCVKD